MVSGNVVRQSSTRRERGGVHSTACTRLWKSLPLGVTVPMNLAKLKCFLACTEEISSFVENHGLVGFCSGSQVEPSGPLDLRGHRQVTNFPIPSFL